MTVVHPDERGAGTAEVERDVEEAEQRGRAGQRGERSLDIALDEESDSLLERDDVGGVRASGDPVLAAEAAHELVAAVEDGEGGQLDPTGVRAGGGAEEAGGEHGATLAARRRPQYAAFQPMEVRFSEPVQPAASTGKARARAQSRAAWVCARYAHGKTPEGAA